MRIDSENDPLAPTSHDPNLEPPHSDTSISIRFPRRPAISLPSSDLANFRRSTINEYAIVSTGHGTTGPFRFEGVAVLELIQQLAPIGFRWAQIEVIGADGFGVRLDAAELTGSGENEPVILADRVDGREMTRHQGLVRLIAPDEKKDALKQIKWVAVINVLD